MHTQHDWKNVCQSQELQTKQLTEYSLCPFKRIYKLPCVTHGYENANMFSIISKRQQVRSAVTHNAKKTRLRCASNCNYQHCYITYVSFDSYDNDINTMSKTPDHLSVFEMSFLFVYLIWFQNLLQLSFGHRLRRFLFHVSDEHVELVLCGRHHLHSIVKLESFSLIIFMLAVVMIINTIIVIVIVII